MSASSVLRIVQFPHPGPEHVPPPDGRRPWQRGIAPHRRTFLSSWGTYRWRAEGPDERGEIEFWGEWEGEATVERPLPGESPYPRWLCRPNPNGAPPESEDGSPPQNTDPFVWGDGFRYSVCRQPTNRKLRSLAPGSLILFGSSLGGEFVLDTVFVVADSTPHSRRTFRELARATSPVHMRATIEPCHGWQTDVETIFRMYIGATPLDTKAGMFSFVPCLPAKADGFPRPEIRLPGLINPNLRMAANCTEPSSLDEVAEVWREVVRQVFEAELALANRLDLPES